LPLQPDPIAIPQDYDPLRDDPIAAAPPPPPPRPVPPPPAPAPAPPQPDPSQQVPPSPPIRPRPGDSEARRKMREIQAGDATARQSIPPRVTPGPASAAANPPAPKAVEIAPRQPSHTADLAQLLVGAGVPDAVITPELSKNLGEILQIVVSGLM